MQGAEGSIQLDGTAVRQLSRDEEIGVQEDAEGLEAIEDLSLCDCTAR